VFAALGCGVAFYLVAAALSQALLAINAGTRAALAWTAAAAALVISYVALPGGDLSRVANSFAIGTFVLLVGLGWLIQRGAETR
jgi:hypothetical protein